MLEVLYFLLVLTTIILWIIWNYRNFIQVYIAQSSLIIALFYILYSNQIITDIYIMISFWIAVLFRLLLIPAILFSFIKKSKIPNAKRETRIWIFVMLLIYSILLWFISYISIKVFWKYEHIFIVSLFMIFAWLLNFVNHKKRVWDILSFLELENWVFLLSLLVLYKIGFYVELWITIDILITLFIFIIFSLKIKLYGENINSTELPQ
jgi:hydrogenase-4 membrane subunit HyfE